MYNTIRDTLELYLQEYPLVYSLSFVLISTLRIFPLMVLGSSSTNSTILGYLYGAVVF